MSDRDIEAHLLEDFKKPGTDEPPTRRPAYRHVQFAVLAAIAVLLPISLLYATLVLTTDRSPHAMIDLDSVRTLITFGDSYTYAQVTPGSNGSIWSWSGGQTWSVALAERHQFVRDDYAVPGKMTDNLSDQLARFDAQGGWEPSSSLVSLWIGVNDFFNFTRPSVNKSEPSVPARLHSHLDDIITFLSEIQCRGASEVVVFNLPPVDRLPWASKENAKPYQELVARWNEELSRRLALFRKSHRLRPVLFDVWTTFSRILDRPEVYGFNQPTGYCDEYAGHGSIDPPFSYKSPACEASAWSTFWHDGQHAGAHAHAIIADDLERMLQSR